MLVERSDLTVIKAASSSSSTICYINSLWHWHWHCSLRTAESPDEAACRLEDLMRRQREFGDILMSNDIKQVPIGGLSFGQMQEPPRRAVSDVTCDFVSVRRNRSLKINEENDRIKTRKCAWQMRCIATWGRWTLRRSFSAIISKPVLFTFAFCLSCVWQLFNKRIYDDDHHHHLSLVI